MFWPSIVASLILLRFEPSSFSVQISTVIGLLSSSGIFSLHLFVTSKLKSAIYFGLALPNIIVPFDAIPPPFAAIFPLMRTPSLTFS